MRRLQRVIARYFARARPRGLLALARLTAAAALLSSLPAGTARGDEPDASSTFDYGLAEMLAGRYATGCPALEASFRRDPRPGTLFTLADCDRKWGKTASALARFEEYAALFERMPPEQRAKPKERERATIAANERATLERSVPLLAVRLPSGAPAGTRVWRDDVELTGPTLAATVPVDPGEHTVRAQLPDGRAVEQKITLEGRDQQTVTVALPSALPAPVVPLPVVAATPPPPPVAAPEGQAAPPPPTRSSHRGWTYTAAGIGAASLVVAGVTGGIALGQRSIASPVCDANGLCTTQAGVNAGNEARAMANVETGAFVVAGVALAAALVLSLTEPRAAARTGSIVWTTGTTGLVW